MDLPCLDVKTFAYYRQHHLDYQLIDVRQPNELAVCQLPEAIHCPFNGQLDVFDSWIDQHHCPVIVMCHHGIRSAHIVAYLKHYGAESVFNLTGGIDAWALHIDPTCPRY